jgi:hypothetical protein
VTAKGNLRQKNQIGKETRGQHRLEGLVIRAEGHTSLFDKIVRQMTFFGKLEPMTPCAMLSLDGEVSSKIISHVILYVSEFVHML